MNAKNLTAAQILGAMAIVIGLNIIFNKLLGRKYYESPIQINKVVDTTRLDNQEDRHSILTYLYLRQEDTLTNLSTLEAWHYLESFSGWTHHFEDSLEINNPYLQEVTLYTEDKRLYPTTYPKYVRLKTPYLQELSFSNIDNDEKVTFEMVDEMPFLRIIDVSSRTLSGLGTLSILGNDDFYTNLETLEYLDIDANIIDTSLVKTIEMMIAHAPNLQQIHIHGGLVEELSLGDFGGNSLETMYVMPNSSDTKVLLLSDLLEQEDLNDVTIYNFRVDTTFCRTDVSLPHLEELKLSSGEFDSFPLFISNSTSLTHLTLKRCNIDAIPFSIENLEQLTHLNLSYNRLTSLPEEIKNLPNLDYLGLYGNNFSKEEQEKIRSWFPSSLEIVF